MEKTVKQVVVDYLQENGIPQNQFEVACGFGKGYMYHFPKNPSIDKMAKIIATYPDLAQPLSEFYPREETELAPRQPKETRPRIPLEVAAGLPGGLGECAKNSDCELMPVISQFPRYDMTIFIKGDSMYPNYQSGDELAIKQVFDYIEWGKVYVLDTREGAVIKRLYDNGDSYLCKSFNQEYPDFMVPKDSVYGIYKVVGLLRI